MKAEMISIESRMFFQLLYRITEDHMDQMPILSELKRTLGQLAVADVTYGASKRQPLMIEVVPQVYTMIEYRKHIGFE